MLWSNIIKKNSGGNETFFLLQSIFQEEEKMAIFGLHYIKVSSFFMPMKWTYKIVMNSQFKIQANCNDHKKFQKDLLIKSTSKLSPKNLFFSRFFWFPPDF